MEGQGGGGAFVLFYLIFLIILGLPIMTMEFAVGRASRKSPVRAYQALEKPGQKWHIHGYLTLIGCYLLMMYYTTVSGWMVSYFGKFLTGAFHSGMSTDEVASAFGAMLSSPGEMALWAEVVVVADAPPLSIPVSRRRRPAGPTTSTWRCWTTRRSLGPGR